jgi:hypothetical protein
MYPIRRLTRAQSLHPENFDHAGRSECNGENARLGFHPAFLDTATFSIHLSRYADGRPAPFHLLDGLPNDVVVARSMFGRVVAAKATLVSGFERNGFFYTRSAAARAAAEWNRATDARA